MKKIDSCMRDVLSFSQFIILRHLVTGNSFEDLEFISAISLQSIGIIMMEPCKVTELLYIII